mmetsp:Transcript_7081/g.9533  ORF Transcript_7081/g.9533 Transcript_7081/m.9533 type:complete len:204 (-) Transcript_7081:314-925(-)
MAQRVFLYRCALLLHRFPQKYIPYKRMEDKVIYLGNHGRGSSRLILPVSRKLAGSPVVTSKTVDTALNQNKTELRVLILTVGLKMLSDLNGLLDKHVKILRDLRCKSVCLKDTDDLVSSDADNLGDTVGITKDYTNLGGGKTLLGKFAHVLLNVSGANLEPGGGAALVGKGRLGDTFSGCMKTSHAVLGGTQEIRMLGDAVKE